MPIPIYKITILYIVFYIIKKKIILLFKLKKLKLKLKLILEKNL